MSRSENGTVAPTAGINQTTGQRLCHIVKRDDFDGYGFNLHSEKGKPGQYIGKVDENSPAEQAGLRHGDRIIEVNGVNIGNETHKQVVQRIKAIANEVRLLVIDPNQEKKNSINSTNATISSSTTTTITTSTTVTPASTLSSIGADTFEEDDVNNKKTINNNNSPIKIDDKNENISGSTSPSVSVKSETNSASCSTTLNNNNNMNKSLDKTDSKDINDLDIPAAIASVTAAVAAAVSATTTPPPPPSSQQQQSGNSHQNGTTTGSTTSTLSNINNSNGSSPTKPSGLNLPMTAAEMRAKLLARKKYDPKNDTVDLRKKFEIIQKL